ncbi:MAG: helix-turn-helix domain-containing protein [Planctomycetota bacterium]
MDTIRQAIEKSGQSRYRIHKETGIDQAVLCKIMAGGTCSMDTADTLCEYLGLELRPKPRKRGR